MDTRPKLKIPLSHFDKKIEIAASFFLTGLWVLTSILYFNLPDIIPIHYNASGVPDNFGSKSTIIILPFIGTLLFWILTKLNRHPHIFNSKSVTIHENAAQQYNSATRIIRFLKVAIVIIFSLIILFTYLTATGKTTGLGVWFLPFIFSLTIIPM